MVGKLGPKYSFENFLKVSSLFCAIISVILFLFLVFNHIMNLVNAIPSSK